jgi:AcrR family transcriptional regulator
VARKKTIADADLLKAARDAFIELGFAAPTRAIARRAGVSEGVLFQRYHTKAELFFAAMVPPPGKPRPTNIRRLGLDLLDYFRSALPVLLPLISHPAFRFEEFAERHPEAPLVAMRRDVTQFFISRRARDPAGAALALIAAMFGIAMFERLGAHGGQMPQQFVEQALSCIARGTSRRS